jgi:hypothetical protein
MSASFLVTLSSENGPIRFRPSPDPPPATRVPQELRKAARRGDLSLPASPAPDALVSVPRVHSVSHGRQPSLASRKLGRRSGRW